MALFAHIRDTGGINLEMNAMNSSEERQGKTWCLTVVGSALSLDFLLNKSIIPH
jgi:hypothetical protein